MTCFLWLRQLFIQKINICYLVYLSPKIRFIVKAIFLDENWKEMEFFKRFFWGRIQNWETAPFHIILYGLDEFIYFWFFFLYHFFLYLISFFSYKNNFSKQEALEHTLDVLTKTIRIWKNPKKNLGNNLKLLIVFPISFYLNQFKVNSYSTFISFHVKIFLVKT